MNKLFFLSGYTILLISSSTQAQTGDYGDAPDGGTFSGAPLNFNSLVASEGPRHTAAATSTFWISQTRFLLTPDVEADSRQVNQDIDNGQPFIFVNLLGIPAPSKLTVPVSTNSSHLPSQTLYLNVAIDVDDDYDYENSPDQNWVVKNRAFTIPADTTIGITSDWFGFGSNLLLFPVWLRATVTSTPVTSGWHNGTTPNAYGSGETEDWFYTFGQDGPYPPEWKDPPRDPGDPPKKKKRKPKKANPTKCIKLKYPKVVYVKCDKVKCFTVEVINCDGIDVKDVKIDFEFAGGVPLPGPPTPVGPADVDANKKKKFVICVFGWPCNPTQEVRWAEYKLKLTYDPEGLYEVEEFDLVFGSGETPFIDSTLTPHLACAPAIDTLDSPVWDGEEGTPFIKHLIAFTGRDDFGMRWIVGSPILLPTRLPPWMTLTQVPVPLLDTTAWALSGTPPMNAPGMDTVIVTVTSSDPTDTTFLIRPLDFVFPMHVNIDNSPPSLDQTFLSTMTIGSGSSLTQTIEASDPDITRGRRDTLWIDYFFVDAVADTVVDPPTLPTFIDNGDGTAAFDWQPDAGDVGNYKLVTVVWDYSFEVDSSVTDLTVTLGIDDLVNSEPSARVSPNPLSDQSLIDIQLPYSMDVGFDVIDARGQFVQAIASRHYSAGAHQIDWDASRLAPGVYLLRVRAGNHLLQSTVVITR